MKVARHDFGPRVRDADERPLQIVVAQSNRFEHGARRGAIRPIGDNAAVPPDVDAHGDPPPVGVPSPQRANAARALLLWLFTRPPCTLRPMNPYRSRTTTHGRNMAGARALWRATGMKDADFEKPIIAIANSFTQFVPGHVHLHDVGQRVKQVIDAKGGVGGGCNTIAVDDGIAMGHGGMLYSLPSRDLIADSVEYMVQAHVADALICISNCDKITPGMLIADMRINTPPIFVSGGPMEAGTSAGTHDAAGKPLPKLDLIDAM